MEGDSTAIILRFVTIDNIMNLQGLDDTRSSLSGWQNPRIGERAAAATSHCQVLRLATEM